MVDDLIIGAFTVCFVLPFCVFYSDFTVLRSSSESTFISVCLESSYSGCLNCLDCTCLTDGIWQWIRRQHSTTEQVRFSCGDGTELTPNFTAVDCTGIAHFLSYLGMKHTPRLLKALYLIIWFDLLCLTPLSAMFQLYHGDQF